jgi:hypothetical protein
VPDCEDERIMPGTARDEAAVQADLVTQGRARLAQIESAVGPTPSAWIALDLRHARAVLADDDEAAECFAAALEADLTRWPYQRTRLLLAQSRWLRRRPAITDPRVPLRAARDAFDALGCAAWADQARRELRASGEHAGPRRPGDYDAACRYDDRTTTDLVGRVIDRSGWEADDDR